MCHIIKLERGGLGAQVPLGIQLPENEEHREQEGVQTSGTGGSGQVPKLAE